MLNEATRYHVGGFLHVDPPNDDFQFPMTSPGVILFVLYNYVTRAMLDVFLANDVQQLNRDTSTQHLSWLYGSFAKQGWHLTPEPIAFATDDDGSIYMINGQHRCRALRHYLVGEGLDVLPVQILASFGWSTEAYTWLDDGKARSDADRLGQILRRRADLAARYTGVTREAVMSVFTALRGGKSRKQSAVRFTPEEVAQFLPSADRIRDIWEENLGDETAWDGDDVGLFGISDDVLAEVVAAARAAAVEAITARGNVMFYHVDRVPAPDGKGTW